jgi:uncharacterized sulfatase
MRIKNYKLSCVAYGILFVPCIQSASRDEAENSSFTRQRPNILFYITDDQSWIYTSLSTRNEILTPGFDKVANEGLCFSNAFCPAPSCAPCRASILTGRYPWQLEEGALLYGGIPRKFPLFTHLLEKEGYELAMCNKGYAPGNMVDTMYHTNPLGRSYQVEPNVSYPDDIANCDYTASFEKFLNERDRDRPFFFWMGVSEPHRKYSKGIGQASGMCIDSVCVPSFLPDKPGIRADLLDYYYEINHQDKHLVRMLELLEQKGEMENTLIIVTSDNGMPFPHAKANLYEYGIHIPLAIRWDNHIKKGRIVDDVVNLADIGPTLLGLTGIPVPLEMSGKNLCNILYDSGSGLIDRANDFTVTAFERHTLCRKGCLTYPMRALRTREWLIIHNLEPDRWPVGDPPPFVPMVYPDYGDVDESPSKRYIIDNQNNEDMRKYFQLTFQKRPEYELYHIPSDPDNLHNLADNPENKKTLKELTKQLEIFLRKTADPRSTGNARWDIMPYYILEDKPVAVDRNTHPYLY